MDYWDLDNPHWMGKAQIIQGTTNAPTKRFMYKRQNMKGMLDGNNQWWQRGFMGVGWSPWGVGAKTEAQRVKEGLKKKKKKVENVESWF